MGVTPKVGALVGLIPDEEAGRQLVTIELDDGTTRTVPGRELVTRCQVVSVDLDLRTARVRKVSGRELTVGFERLEPWSG